MEWALYSKLVRCEIRITAPSSPLLRGGQTRPLPNKGQIRQEKKQRKRERKKSRLLPRKIEIPISTNVALISTREQVFLLIERIEKLSSLYIKRSDWRPTNKMVWSSQTYNITCSHCFLYFSSCTMLKTEDWVNIHYYNRRTLTDRIYL